VDARALAVPHAEHAVVLAFAAQLGLLRAPDRGRRKVLVQARLEQHVVTFERRPGAHELLVEPAERRAAVARHVARGIEPGAPSALLLHQAGADQGLIAGDEHAAPGKIVFVVEGDVLERHWASESRSGRLPTRRQRQSRRRLAQIKASAGLPVQLWSVVTP